MEIISLDHTKSAFYFLKYMKLLFRHFLQASSKIELETMLRDRDKTLGDILSMTLKSNYILFAKSIDLHYRFD